MLPHDLLGLGQQEPLRWTGIRAVHQEHMDVQNIPLAEQKEERAPGCTGPEAQGLTQPLSLLYYGFVLHTPLT